jgi:hypothetical protein
MCFVDDDIILNSSWYTKCMRALQEHPEIIAVCGRAPETYTLGCMICRTEEFKRSGGFPPLDDGVFPKLGPRILILEDAVCEHQVGKGFGPLEHSLHYFCHGFQTENRAGWCYHPIRQVGLMYEYFKLGYPDWAVAFGVWLLKTPFVLPFILEDRRDRKKRKG